jgi:spore coat polysaccharide biosynthesis protein SpsF (cytidylyltransferase family)
VEVLAARALRRAHLEAGPAAERADATAFVRAHPERFPSLSVPFPGSVSAAGRWTVDDPADLDFARAVYARLYRPGAPPFGWREVHDLLAREPGLGSEASALGRPISRPE